MLSRLSPIPENEKPTEEKIVCYDCKYCKNALREARVSSFTESMHKFYCEVCEMGFILEQNCKFHLRGFTHNYGNLRRCMHCEATFYTDEEHSLHYLFMHKLDEDKDKDKPHQQNADRDGKVEQDLNVGEASEKKKEKKKKKRTSLQQQSQLLEGQVLGSPSQSTSTLSADEKGLARKANNQKTKDQPQTKETPLGPVQKAKKQGGKIPHSSGVDACTQTKISIQDKPNTSPGISMHVLEARTCPHGQIQLVEAKKSTRSGRKL